MPGIRAILGALVASACAVALTACGGDDEDGPIPAEAGNEMLAQLDDIEADVNEGNCNEAHRTALTFVDRLNQLPEEVGGELRDALVQASANLEALTENPDQCTPTTGATGETDALETTTPETTETTTETTTTDETTEEPPTDDDEGEGEGDEGGPPEEPSGEPGGGEPGGGQPGGGEPGGGQPGGGDGSSGGIGSDG